MFVIYKLVCSHCNFDIEFFRIWYITFNLQIIEIFSHLFKLILFYLKKIGNSHILINSNFGNPFP